MTELQHELLSLICDSTRHEGDCTDNPLVCYWVPDRKNDWCETLQKDIFIDGAGVASCLNAFVRKGWTKHLGAHKYACAITELGRTELEKHRENTGFYLRRR